MNNDKEKIGQVRFNKNQNMAQIDIAIAPNFRGQGYGTLSLTKSCEFYFNNFEIDYIIAKIKKENAASIKAFEKAGFKLYEKKENKVELRLNNPKK